MQQSPAIFQASCQNPFKHKILLKRCFEIKNRKEAAIKSLDSLWQFLTHRGWIDGSLFTLVLCNPHIHTLTHTHIYIHRQTHTHTSLVHHWNLSWEPVRFQWLLLQNIEQIFSYCLHPSTHHFSSDQVSKCNFLYCSTLFPSVGCTSHPGPLYFNGRQRKREHNRPLSSAHTAVRTANTILRVHARVDWMLNYSFYQI